MTSLVILPRSSDAFSAYKPSKNAHIDILAPQAKDKGASGKVLRLDLHRGYTPISTRSFVLCSEPPASYTMCRR